MRNLKVHQARKEPFFGEGAVPFVLQIAGLAVALGLVLGTLLLAKSAYSNVHAALFGAQQTAPHLEPGESTVIDGVKIKRIN